MKWTPEQRQEIADYLDGTCLAIDEACRICEIPPIEDMEDAMLEEDLERCKQCDWWMESALLNNDTICVDCE